MDPNALYALLYGDIQKRSRPLVVGINGAYTSGKTMFAQGFGEYLRARGVKVQVIHYDDFHHPFHTISWTDETEVDAFYNRAFHPEKLVSEVLEPIRAQGRLQKELACVNLGSGDFSNVVSFDIDGDTIVLLEGVLLFRPPILEYLDYKVYLAVSEQEMLHRAKLRDVPRFGEGILDKFITRYIPAQRRYTADWDPAGASDRAIDNDDPRAPEITPHPGKAGAPVC